jgi:hypothetical protein
MHGHHAVDLAIDQTAMQRDMARHAVREVMREARVCLASHPCDDCVSGRAVRQARVRYEGLLQGHVTGLRHVTALTLPLCSLRARRGDTAGGILSDRLRQPLS